ncbi:hypothetical protein BJ994_003495 [Arthrobacter pigmenti]|uniref:Antitoxin Xre/MbcA/ParS-like toxin-binding domain-containing protein n=1 Tax=Arthrobacter pigmenti TaxID=271432 RepID=A0A846RTQ0_9MICC|nr:hypothetical protein [Arthrobacter pigmenti]NJC24419.1 hypothetical protein [Arthrobacter pigmenti]
MASRTSAKRQRHSAVADHMRRRRLKEQTEGIDQDPGWTYVPIAVPNNVLAPVGEAGVEVQRITRALQSGLQAQMATFSRSLDYQLRNAMLSTEVLRSTLSVLDEPPSTQAIRGLLATEHLWREIEDEFGMLTAAEVADKVGSKAKARNGYALDKRKAGGLIGVERLNSIVYPGFQFTSTGTILSAVPRLVNIIKEHAKSEEGLVQWLCSPSGYLEGDRPVDHMDDIEAVVGAAQGHYGVEW